MTITLLDVLISVNVNFLYVCISISQDKIRLFQNYLLII